MAVIWREAKSEKCSVGSDQSESWELLRSNGNEDENVVQLMNDDEMRLIIAVIRCPIAWNGVNMTYYRCDENHINVGRLQSWNARAKARDLTRPVSRPGANLMSVACNINEGNGGGAKIGMASESARCLVCTEYNRWFPEISNECWKGCGFSNKQLCASSLV